MKVVLCILSLIILHEFNNIGDDLGYMLSLADNLCSTSGSVNLSNGNETPHFTLDTGGVSASTVSSVSPTAGVVSPLTVGGISSMIGGISPSTASSVSPTAGIHPPSTAGGVSPLVTGGVFNSWCCFSFDIQWYFFNDWWCLSFNS